MGIIVRGGLILIRASFQRVLAMIQTPLIALVSFLTLVSELFAAPDNHDPIMELKGLSAEEAVFKGASRTKPVVLKSSENGAKYFGKEALAKISKAVDFEKQSVLVFAWKGSGQDRLQYVLKEAFPEQIVFSYKRGRTKDFRSHVKVYVLRLDVKWAAE
ncbi:MAG TPA: hypothetical protein DIV46_12130 [Verrucomicrobiales bacterium]|nr:hypothetical protein [Verrucomicrobiales bacterium]